MRYLILIGSDSTPEKKGFDNFDFATDDKEEAVNYMRTIVWTTQGAWGQVFDTQTLNIIDELPQN